VSLQEACSGTFVTAGGFLAPRVWQQPVLTFDTFGAAMVTVFELSLLEGARA
jgi:hypothetical protein